MIELKKLFSFIRGIDSEEAKKFMAEHPEGSYTLLDVRQPSEYEREHLPGAKLIPLGQLGDSLKKIDKDKLVLVPCQRPPSFFSLPAYGFTVYQLSHHGRDISKNYLGKGVEQCKVK